MARVTVEDCVEVVENRFELVVLAAHRAKQITSGVPILVERDNDKNAVIALREIGDRKINVDQIRESVIQTFQTTIKHDRLEDEIDDMEDDGDAVILSPSTLSEELADDMEEIIDENDIGDLSFEGDNLDVDD